MKDAADRSLWRAAAVLVLLVAAVSQLIRPLLGLSAWSWWVTLTIAAVIVVGTATLQFAVTRGIAREREDSRP